jgi:hypothetical protein
MFFNYLKGFFFKRICKKRIRDVKNSISMSSIKTVGVIVDEDCFFKKEALLKGLISFGILENNIKMIVFKDKASKEEVGFPVFNFKDINWKFEFSNPEVNDFINQKVDLLISYYDIEKPILLHVTNCSKAQFKVGFSTVDTRLNHFMINTNIENYIVFIQEMFKYLKILNKI